MLYFRNKQADLSSILKHPATIGAGIGGGGMLLSHLLSGGNKDDEEGGSSGLGKVLLGAGAGAGLGALYNNPTIKELLRKLMVASGMSDPSWGDYAGAAWDKTKEVGGELLGQAKEELAPQADNAMTGASTGAAIGGGAGAIKGFRNARKPAVVPPSSGAVGGKVIDVPSKPSGGMKGLPAPEVAPSGTSMIVAPKPKVKAPFMRRQGAGARRAVSTAKGALKGGVRGGLAGTALGLLADNFLGAKGNTTNPTLK